MVGKKYVSKDDLEAFARKLTRRVSGSSIHGGGNGGGGASDCFWTKVGNDIYYDDGIVGIRTITDDVRDAELQWAVGAADVTKYTMGVDDDDADAWLLCSGDILSSLVTPAVTGGIIYTYDGTILIEGGDNYLKLMRVSDGAFLDEIGGSGTGDGQFDTIRGICNDGTYAYVVEQGNDRLQKIRISDMTFVAKIGSLGSNNDQFNNPWKICSDGTYLYIVDSGNSRVVKRLCSDLSYDSKSSGTLNIPRNIAIDGTYLFVSQNSGAANRLVLMSAGDLSFLGAMANDGHIDSCTITEAIYKNGYLWLCNANLPGSLKTVYKYQVSLVAPYFAYVTHFLVGNSLVADEFYVGWSLDLDDTQIYLFNTRNSPGDPQEIYITTLSGTFVRRWGQYGTHDIDFVASLAISLVGTMSTPTTPLRGPILKAGLDLSYCDSYPLFRARDGLQLMEDGTVGATDYVGLYAPAAITAPYGLTFPGAGPSEASYFEVSAAGAISWAHVADIGSTHNHDGSSPAFSGLELTGFSGVLWASGGVVYDGAILGDLDDVYFPSGEPDVGDVLTYQSGGWTSGPGGGAVALDDLTDVDAITDLTDQDVLTWDAGSGLWIALPPPAAGPHDLGSHTDVDFPSGEPDIGDVLTYEPGGWTSMPGGGGGTHSLWFPDAFPDSPTAQSDHFDDASLAVKWHEFDSAGKVVITEANHHVKFASTSLINNHAGMWQTLPSGNFTITAKMRTEYAKGVEAKYFYWGITLFQDATNNPATSDILIFHVYSYNNTVTPQILHFSDYDSYSSAPYTGGTFLINPTQAIYFRVRRNGTSLYFDLSLDNLSWKQFSGAIAQGSYFTPAEFGITCYQESGAEQYFYCDWIYYQASDNFEAVAVGQSISI